MVRIKTISFTTPNQSNIQYTLSIPSCIDPEYWTCHKLTQKDIRNIITHVPSWLMWITAVMYNKMITWAMVKYSFSDTFGTMVNNKVLAMQHILKFIEYDISTTTHDRIDTLSYSVYKHIPPLPKYKIDIAVFEFLVTKIVPNLQPCIFQSDYTIIPYCEEFNGKMWVPTVCESNEYICMVALYEKNTNIESFGSGYSHMPKMGMYNGEIVTLSDEIIWVCK